MPQENKSLDQITEQIKQSLESQAQVIDSAVSSVVDGVQSDNKKFVDELDVIKGNILGAINTQTQGGKLSGLDIDKSISLSSLMGDMGKLDNLNLVLGLKFLKVKRNILKSVDSETQGGKLTGLEIDKKISLSDLLGESPNLNIIHAMRWLRIKKNILKKVETATEGVELELDSKMSLNDVLGSTPDQDILTKTRFFLIRQGLLSRISKAAKDFDPQQSVDEITGGLGGGRVASGGGAGASDLSSSDDTSEISEATRGTFSILSEMRDASLGDALQDRENRKEDLALEEKRTEALSSVTGDSSKGGGEGGGKGIGGKLSGIGEGAGKGISAFLKGLGSGLKAISKPKYLIGAGVLIALAGALFVTGKALQTFVNIDWKNVLYGLGVLTALGIGAALLGKLGPQILIGSLAIAALGAALIPAGIAFGMFSDIDWKGVGIGIGVLTALGVAAFGLSFIAPFIFVGALAIAALGAALIPAAAAFNLFSIALGGLSEFLPILGEFMDGVVGGLIELSSAGPGLLIAGAGILAVSGALIAFGASSALGGLLSFFGGDPIEKFLELADKSSGLSASAKAIDSIAAALERLDSDKVEDIGDSLKGVVKQLKSLSKLDLGQAAELFSFFGGAGIGSGAAPSVGGAGIGSGAAPSVGGVYEEKTGKKTSQEKMAEGRREHNKPFKEMIDSLSEDDKEKIRQGVPASRVLSPEQRETIQSGPLARSQSSSSRIAALKKFDLKAKGILQQASKDTASIEAAGPKPQPTASTMGQEISPIVKTSDISDGAAASLKTDPVDRSDNIKSRELKQKEEEQQARYDSYLKFQAVVDEAKTLSEKFESDNSKLVQKSTGGGIDGDEPYMSREYNSPEAEKEAKELRSKVRGLEKQQDDNRGQLLADSLNTRMGEDSWDLNYTKGRDAITNPQARLENDNIVDQAYSRFSIDKDYMVGEESARKQQDDFIRDTFDPLKGKSRTEATTKEFDDRRLASKAAVSEYLANARENAPEAIRTDAKKYDYSNESVIALDDGMSNKYKDLQRIAEYDERQYKESLQRVKEEKESSLKLTPEEEVSKIEAVDVSTGANLDLEQRQVNQMKESEALQASSAAAAPPTIVSNGGNSSSVSNTTINSSAHIDRTMELVPAF